MGKSIPFSASKYSPPRLVKIIDRPRLFNRLDQARNSRSVLIIGQGAQGKSTLAASYINHSNQSLAWLNLGKEDADPVNLFLSLIQAVHRICNHKDLVRLTELAGMSMGPREPIPLYREWAGLFYEILTIDLHIVFDGLDNLSPNAPAFPLIQILLEEAPGNIRFMMLSRSTPPLQIERMKINNEAVVLDNTDLAFTLEETRRFVRQRYKLSTTPEQMEVIQRTTEGWVGGLILMCESIGRVKENLSEVIKWGSNIDGFRGNIFKYFSEQVFDALPDHIQDFLVKTSVVDTVNPALLIELFENENSVAFIEDMSRRNVFVTYYHAQGNTICYRFHQLFLDFLRSKFMALFSKENQKKWLVRVGRAFENQGDDESALNMYIEAEEYEPAALILERIGMDFLKDGQTGRVARWLEALPTERIANNPWLLTYLCMTRRFTEAQTNIRDLDAAMALFRKKGDVRGQILAMSLIINNKLFTVSFDRDLTKEGLALLDHLKTDEYPYERAQLLLGIALANTMRDNTRTGLWAYQSAFVLGGQLENQRIQAEALIGAIQAQALLGEFEDIERSVPKIEQMLNRFKSRELWAVYRINYSFYLLFSGNFKSARKLAKTALEDIQTHGIFYMLGGVFLVSLIDSVLTEDHAAAEHLFGRIQNQFPKPEFTAMISISTFYMGLLAYRKNDHPRALVLMNESHDLLRKVMGPEDIVRCGVNIVKGLLDYHMHDKPIWESKLDETGDYLKRTQSKLLLIQYHLVKALLGWKKKDRVRAAYHLEAGLKSAENSDYNFFPLIKTSDVVKACTLAVELQVEPVLNYVTILLSGSYADHAARELDRCSRHRRPAVREMARTIKESILRKGMPRIRIETLGEFRVWRDRDQVEEEDWPRPQAKLLLKAIVTYGRRGIPKDLIIDALWPDAKPAAAEKNFDTTLHRLRKALEPKMERAFGSSYIQLKENMISFTELVEDIDLDGFLALADSGAEKERQGDQKAALALYDKALVLYKGEYLSGDLYLPWVQEKRDEIKKRHLRVLINAAGLYEKRGAVRKAIPYYKKAIEVEPAFEEAYRRLMVLYAGLGRRNEAIKTYDLCEKNLKKLLDIHPETITASLYKKILEET